MEREEKEEERGREGEEGVSGPGAFCNTALSVAWTLPACWEALASMGTCETVRSRISRGG